MEKHKTEHMNFSNELLCERRMTNGSRDPLFTCPNNMRRKILTEESNNRQIINVCNLTFS